MSRRAAVLVALSLLPARLQAQNLDLQHHHPALTTTGLSAVKGAASEPAWAWTFSTHAIYMRDPLVVLDENGDRVAALVADRLDLVTGVALGLGVPALVDLGIVNGIDLGVAVPVVLVQHREAALRNGELTRIDKIGAGLADPRLEARITLPLPDWGFDLAVIPVVSFPAAVGTRYAGSGSVVFTPELAGSGRVGPVLIGANVGVRIREEREVKGLSIPHQLLWRAGVGFDVGAVGGPEDLLISAEAFGLTGLTAPFASFASTPFELLFAGRFRVGDALLGASVGPGLTSGYGAPALRVVASFAWAPRDHDADDDGLLDDVDACVEVPEDRDAFEDADGCPDPDNDGDGLLDVDDVCPTEAEDQDSFRDDDGCPEPDNDADKVLDTVDPCPDVPEDFDTFEDDDGCPDLDNDKDGVLDPRDACPLEPEDVDDFRDVDGCPDPDNDEDRFLDPQDPCPLQAEDYNGHKDDDGCPDAQDDRDGDGLRDRDDTCPSVPEDQDAFEDEDGCPDVDNDQDGVIDAKDGCPLEAEDLDQFMDEDGCVEDDNDGDGIWDRADKCPNEAEAINAFEDDDGCPDEGRTLVKLTSEKIEIAEKVYFEYGSSKIDPRSFPLLDQVVALLKNHTDIGKLRVEGHTDDRGADNYNLELSQRRADAVRIYIVDKGILPLRLEAVGYGETKPVAPNSTPRGRETNRRVEFTIVTPGGPQ